MLGWEKEEEQLNTPGTAGGPGGRDRTLALKSRKTPENQKSKAKNGGEKRRRGKKD